MLNISAISNHTTTGRSNSFDISELNSSPRSKLLKHAMKSSSISSAYDLKSATPLVFKEDLHAKLAFMTAEVDRLTYINSELMTEIEDWKRHFREAEKLIGKNATITINKTVIDDQVNRRCRELEQMVTDLSTQLELSFKIPKAINQTNETFEMASNEAETWKDRYMNMEKSYLKEIESLKSKLSTAIFESNHKRKGTEMTPKAKGDLIRTPRFAKENLRPLMSESSPGYGGDIIHQHHQIVPLQLQLSNIEEKMPSENFDEFSERAEPIYMKALIFEDSNEKCEKRIDLSIVEAIKGDDALSFDQSFTEEKLSESLNRLNRSLENAATCIESIPKKCNSKENANECCKTREIELEKLKEEIRKLRRDVSGYEVVAVVLSKKAQEARKLKKEKEDIEQELKVCKQQLLENEKRVTLPTSQEVFNVQDYDSKSRIFSESPRKVLESTKQQIELQNEKEALTSQLNETHNLIKSASEKEEKLQLEINRLNQVIEENQSTLKAYEQEKSKLQGGIFELEKVVQSLNIEISAWKSEYAKLDNRRKQHRRAGSDSLTSNLKTKFEQNEQKVAELLKENNNLNETIKLKSVELDDLRRSHKEMMEKHKEEMSQKWIQSCMQMEEIVLSLESRKNNMQGQLERMQAIVGTNTQKLEGLYEQNEAFRQENQFLLEEIRKLKAKEEEYKTLLSGLKERL